MNRIQQMELKHQEALSAIAHYQTNAKEPEMKAITEYLLETDVNPYDFLPEGWAISLETSTGFISLLNTIHHALYDDGEISFPIVNGSPRIAFVCSNQDNYDQCILTKTEKHTQSRWGRIYNITQARNILEFIKIHREYHDNDILRRFVHDAALQGWEFALEAYSKYSRFDPAWEFDNAVIAQVEKIRIIFGLSKA